MSVDTGAGIDKYILEVSTGGQLAKDETFMDGVLRHFRRELALEVNVDENRFMAYQFSNRDGELIPGIRYICWHISGKPQLVNYDEFNWVKLPKFESIPDEEFLPNTKNDILALLKSIDVPSGASPPS